MKRYFTILFTFFCSILLAQVEENADLSKLETKGKEIKPAIDLYKIYTLDRDTTFVDTSLTIKDEYRYNYLRKDIFGLMPFANEGHTYNTLNFGLIQKHFLNGSLLKNLGHHYIFLRVDEWQIP